MIAKFFSSCRDTQIPDIEPIHGPEETADLPEDSQFLRKKGTWDIFHGIRHLKYAADAYRVPHVKEGLPSPLDGVDRLIGFQDPLAEHYMLAYVEYEDGESCDLFAFTGGLYLCNNRGKTIERVFVEDHLMIVPKQPGSKKIVEE